ncbi:threonine aldolase family protein [Paenibacillus sp. FSL K6-1230]|uniref:threonine aldolase family protein n=1 Tax=Paenibacillus sp. FSL K6-1230 TaxID=2921603 RepID=UPI00039FBFBF
MAELSSLREAYRQAPYPLGGHHDRKLRVLTEALEQLDPELDSDMYGKGEIIENFEHRLAQLTGKEAAVFFPSGTMAQQIALRIWCDRVSLKRVAYHPLCHLEIHEEDGLKELHHIEPILLADEHRLITLEDVQALDTPVSCLLLELPQREIGGQLPSYEELVAIADYCRGQGIRLHLDGARLLEVTPYYGRTVAELCGLFDSVYISFYKGVGSVAGAILTGSADFIDESKRWKRRYGGDLISLYPYILSADYYLTQRIGKMEHYYLKAKEAAAQFNACHATRTLPEVPVSNMFHVHFEVSQQELEPILIAVMEQSGIGFTPYLHATGENSCYYELSLGDRYADIPKDRLHEGFRLLDQALRELREELGK